MNVTCPQCTTVFRVDPAKVPERGVRARCSVCGGLIAVRREAPSVPESPAVSPRLPAPAPSPVAEPAAPAAADPAPAAPIVAPPTAAPSPPQVAAPVTPAPAAPPPADPAPSVMAAPPAPPPVAFDALPPREAEAPPVARSTAAPEPVPAPPPTAAPSRFSNPFLQQDPATRARRLARALVSDLVVYHPEKRQRGLADGNLKELFAEEIRKSWDEYTEQVGEDVARTTPYFTEALNEILAEGRTLFG